MVFKVAGAAGHSAARRGKRSLAAESHRRLHRRAPRGKHLTSSPEADRRTLIRCLSYDLTGLPPSSEELAAFLADDSPQAFENLVDRLLASPRYGEHWARHWLDAASYADNRVWHWHFGRGLCDTPNDFGKMGGAPSHPKLIDWLAVWFRDDTRSSLKALHRLILTSQAGRQSSLTRQGTATDTDNRLLWRGNRRRLSAEEIRDTLLLLSGQLDSTMGRPAAVQFISKGDATFNPGGNPSFVDYENFDPDNSAARGRAVYRFVFRTAAEPTTVTTTPTSSANLTPPPGAWTAPPHATLLHLLGLNHEKLTLPTTASTAASPTFTATSSAKSWLDPGPR